MAAGGGGATVLAARLGPPRRQALWMMMYEPCICISEYIDINAQLPAAQHGIEEEGGGEGARRRERDGR